MAPAHCAAKVAVDVAKIKVRKCGETTETPSVAASDRHFRKSACKRARAAVMQAASLAEPACVLNSQLCETEGADAGHDFARDQGFSPGGSGGGSRIKVMVTRRLAASVGSSGNSGWLSARPDTE